MNIEYIELVKEQEAKYMVSEKSLTKGGHGARHGQVSHCSDLEASHSRDEGHINIPWLENYFYPGFNQ